MNKQSLVDFKTTLCNNNLCQIRYLSFVTLKEQLQCPYYHDDSDKRRNPKLYKPIFIADNSNEMSDICNNIIEYMYHPLVYGQQQVQHNLLNRLENLIESKLKEFDQTNRFKYFYRKEVNIIEDATHEFKNLKILRLDLILNYICAFLNTQGGTLYIGISDNGLVKGIKLTRADIDGFQLELDNYLRQFDPIVLPSQIKVDYYPVYYEDYSPFPQLYVIEILIIRVGKELYFNHQAGINKHVKTQGDKRLYEIKLLLNMMFLDSQSKHIQTTSVVILQQMSQRVVTVKDYNDTLFQIGLENKIFYLQFKCPYYQEIFAINKEYFLANYLNGFQVEEPQNGFDIKVSLDVSQIDPKNKEHKERIIQISADISKFRRNFYASVYEQAFENIIQGKPSAPIMFKTRDNETIFIVSQKDSLSVFYEVNFTDKVDKTIGGIIIQELSESVRHVQNSPPIGKTTIKQEVLVNSFGDLTKYKIDPQSTIVTITLFQKQHFQTSFQKQATLLQGFRQYLHYHIHASKTYLHSRIVKRINQFARTLNQAKYEKDVLEEEKQGTVFKRDDTRTGSLIR
ncbi:hypothetical protein pb186bvf_012652 [Paramecium bursaria]